MTHGHAQRLLALAAALACPAAAADQETVALLNQSTSGYVLEYAEAGGTPISVRTGLGKPYIPVAKAGDRVTIPPVSAGRILVQRVQGALHATFKLSDPRGDSLRVEVTAAGEGDRPTLVPLGRPLPGVELTDSPKLEVVIVKGTLK